MAGAGDSRESFTRNFLVKIETGAVNFGIFWTMFPSVMLRFVLPVAFASCVVAYFGLPYIERLLAEWFRSDVELRAQLVMHSMEEPITELVEKGLDKGGESRLRTYL